MGPPSENSISITARQIFDPGDDRTVEAAPPTTPRSVRQDLRAAAHPRALVRLYLDYYRDPLAWFGLLVTLLVVAYAGGAVMFVLHAVVLGELGPAISPVAHWMLDSTLGFLGLGPVVALIVPVAAWVATRLAGAVRPLPYALVGGTLFALAAGPGPIAHDLLVGRGTWLANRVTDLLGSDVSAVAHGAHGPGDAVPQALSIGSQLAVGVPAYVLLMWASLALVRTALRHRSAVLSAHAVLDATPAE
jgi:hypothetical protein